MSNQRYTPEFKDEAVRQILEKGHSVPEVSERLGVSSHSLYKWVNAVKPSENVAQANELLDAKQEMGIGRIAARNLAIWKYGEADFLHEGAV